MGRLRSIVVVLAGAAVSACGLFVDLGGLADEDPPPAQPAADATTTAPDATTTPGTIAASGDASADVATVAPYRAAVLADAPIGYWPLDDEPGSLVVKDIAGGHDAAVKGVMTFGASAIAGAAIDFTDGDAYLDVGDVDAFDLVGKTPFAIEAWTQPKLAVTYNHIAFKRDHEPAFMNGWVFYVHRDGNVKFEQPFETGSRTAWLHQPIPVARPMHVVVSFDGTNLALYVDGVSSLNAYGAGAGPVPSRTSLTFAGSGYTGLLDEIAIYDHALPPQRVQAHYKAAGR